MLSQDIPALIAKELQVRPNQVAAAIQLLDDGNTVPFIARYRKEVTGKLEDEQLRIIEERLTYLRNFVKRQEEIIAKIDEQGKLTAELKTALEKGYQIAGARRSLSPLQAKERTRAQQARERGLEPLANAILQATPLKTSVAEFAATFINHELAVDSSEAALNGAQDIVAEVIMENAALRQSMREYIYNHGHLATILDESAPDAQIFAMYADYDEPIRQLPSHRILAINRGEAKNCLKVQLVIDHAANCQTIYKKFYRKSSVWDSYLQAAIDDGYKRLLFPALEREIRNQLTESAEIQAIKVFGVNLRQLLLQAPLAGHTVMGLDPGYRTGCKMAIVDPTGQVLEHGVLYLTHSDAQRQQAEQKVLTLIKKHQVTLLSIGNGTASYETEQFVANLIQTHQLDNVHYLITNEAGASVYSASALAKEELPQYDVTIRGAVSIARRVQDPLAELVKIDPKAIGIGQYQHDVNQKELSHTLDATIEATVNHVGVELNTASAALLKHVAGVSNTIAKNIITYRNEHGIFNSRKELLKVPRLGPAAFTQCAGFLRIQAAPSPLDNTSVHPESYQLAEQILTALGFTLADLHDKQQLALLAAKAKLVDTTKLAQKLGAGEPTVKDIILALTKPGRDPREDLPAPLTRQAIVKLSDIKPGTIMRGTVRNITDFGAFVDIGIKTAGLIHISELSNQRVKHPLDVLSVGDILTVLVISVDEARNRIGLSLKQVPKEKIAV